MIANSPLPYTRPSLAERYTTTYIIGSRTGAIQRNDRPNFAPALAYVPMAEGSSSAAPVMTPVPTALSSPPSLALGWSSVFGAGIPLSVQSHRAEQAPLQLLTKSANAGDGRTFREPRHCERSACSQPALRSPAAQATLARFICVGTLVRLQGNQRKRCYNVHPRTQYLCKCCLADGASLAILILQS